MRKGRIADANCLSLKISKLLTETREKQLADVNHKDIGYGPLSDGQTYYFT